MSNVTIYCPPENPPFESGCGDTQAFTWTGTAVTYIQFFIPYLNKQYIKFYFDYVSNNGSSLVVDAKYYRNNQTVTGQTWNLGVLTTNETLYHYLDLGTTTGTNNYITLQIKSTGGSTGQFNITLDCDITVTSEIFCTGGTVSETCDCENQITLYAEPDSTGRFPFYNSPWYTDSSLQNEAPCGDYATLEGTKFIVYYYNCIENKPEILGYCPTTCEVKPCNSISRYTHSSTTYTFLNPLIESKERNNNTFIAGEYFGKIKYSKHCATIEFPQGSTGIYAITVGYTGSTTRDAQITFEDAAYSKTNSAPGQLSYSIYPPDQSPFFLPQYYDGLLDFEGKNLTPITYYIIPPKSGLVLVKLMIGKYKEDNFGNIFTSISGSCTATPIYSYNAGLHVYSAYDSIVTPRLSTTVYSKTPLASWTKNSTIIYNDNYFLQPAFPYWYSVSGNTYKVGSPLRRDFGTITQYLVTKKAFTRYADVEKITTPFKNQIQEDITTGYRRVPTCVELLADIGVLKDIVPLANVIQPTKYKYFVGKSDVITIFGKLESNDGYFNITDPDSLLEKRNCYPATGFEHAVDKFGAAYISMIPAYLDKITNAKQNYENLQKALRQNAEGIIQMFAGIGAAMVGLFIIGVFAFGGGAGQNGYISQRAADRRRAINSRRISRWTGKGPDGLQAGKSFIISKVRDACYSNPVLFKIVAVVLIVTAIILFVVKIRRTVQACCKQFWLVNTTGPYIMTGDVVYLNKALTIPYTNGWICDGAYYYRLSGGTVASKELSYTFRGNYQYYGGGLYNFGARVDSLTPDEPDTYITDITRLYFLPYVSGVPDGYTTNPLYQSNAITGTVYTDVTITGELNYPLPNEFDLEQGFFTSEVSQLDADTQAEEYFNTITAETQTTFGSFTYNPNVNFGLANFSHEIKFEDTPRQVVCFYDNSNNSGLTIGKKVYLDSGGYSKCLTGYYSFSSETYFREFFLVLSGEVADIYTMASSGSTTVSSTTTGGTVTISQTHKDFTSGWYQLSPLGVGIQNLPATWSSNDFYNSENIKRGFVRTPLTADTFYVYDTNLGTASTYSEAIQSYYLEVQNYEEQFFYSRNETLIINSVQVCTLTGSGINFEIVDTSGQTQNSIYGISFVAAIYTASTFDYSYNISIQPSESSFLLPLEESYNGQITSVSITAYTTSNPINKVTFTAGTFTSCVRPTNTPTITPSVTQTPTLTPSVTPTNTLTPTNSVTPTTSITPTITQTPTNTPTPTSPAIQYNLDPTNYSTAENACRNGVLGGTVKYLPPTYTTPQNGIYVYNDSNLTSFYDGGDQYHKMFRGGSSWAVRIGTGGLISDVVDCSTIPSLTSTPTVTSTPTITPTNTITPTVTPSTTPLGSAIQLSTPQNDECVACRLTSYSQTRYVSPSDSTPTIGDIVYQNVELTTVFNGNSQWFKTTWGSPTEYSIQIATNGQVLDVTNCSTCPSQTPTPTPTTSETPTPTITPTNTLTPSITETPTETPTPTPTPIPCYEYTATAGQTDLDNSDNQTVYFEYTDCNGNPQTLQRGTTSPATQCATSVGSVYILIGGSPSAATSSSWSVAGSPC